MIAPKKQQLYNTAYWLVQAGLLLLPEQQVGQLQQVAFQRFLESTQLSSSGLSKDDFEAQLQLIHPNLWDKFVSAKYVSANNTGQYFITPVYFQAALKLQHKQQKQKTQRTAFFTGLGAFWAAICLAVVYTQYIQNTTEESSNTVVRATPSGQVNINQKPMVLQTSWEGLEVQREIASALFDAPNDRNQTLERLITEYEGKMEKMPFRAWVALASLYELQNDTEKQLFACNEVLQQDSTYLPAYCGRARAYISMGNYSAAIDDYNHVLVRDKASQEAYDGLAKIHQVKGNNEDALSVYSDALQRDPKNDKIWIKRAVIYTDMQLYDKAIKDYSKALQLNPNSPRIWMDRGGLYELMGQLALAAADYKQAVLLEPTRSDWHQKRYQVIEKMQSAALANQDNPDEIVASSYNGDNIDEFDINDSSFSDVIEEQGKHLMPIQQLHPKLRNLAWVLGKWEINLGNNEESVWEEWRVKNRNKISGIQYNIDHTTERRFWVEYNEESDNAILYMAFQDNEDYYGFDLVSSDNSQVVFSQSTNTDIPVRIIFQRNPLEAGYEVRLQNAQGGRFSVEQAAHLEKCYKVSFQKAVCNVKPVTKGRL